MGDSLVLHVVISVRWLCCSDKAHPLGCALQWEQYFFFFTSQITPQKDDQEGEIHFLERGILQPSEEVNKVMMEPAA